MHPGKVYEKNWLVVSDSIPKPSKGIEPPMHPIATHRRALLSKRRMECLTPKCRVISWPKQPHPKPKTHFGHN